MRTPVFLRTADQLAQWLERFNPIKGATLNTLSGYFEEADEGRFAHVMWMARKMIRRDPVIRACVRRLLTEMQALDWQIKMMEELPAGVTESQAKAQAAYLKEQYSGITNLKQAYTFLARSDFLGFAHLEKHYGARGEVVKLQPVPQWHWVRKGLYGTWHYNASANPYSRDLVEIQPPDFIIMEVEDPWLEIGLVAGLDRNQVDRDLRGYMARYGIPNTFFIAGPGTSDDDLDDLNDVASEMVSDGTGVLPNGADVKTHESSSKGEIFELADKHFAQQIVLAATGGLLTMLTESGSGTLAGGAHSDSWRKLACGVAADISENMQAQYDEPLIKERFPGQPVAVYFELEYPEEQTDRKELTETAKALKDSGITVKRDWLSEELGIPFEDVEVVKEEPAKPGQEVKPAPGQGRQPPTASRPPSTSLRNRFLGGPPSARDRAEVEELVAGAIADSLDVMRGTLAPLSPQIQDLIDLASDDQASVEQFTALAEQVAAFLPELVTDDSIAALTSSIEAALGSAAALGARASIRKRAGT